MEKLKLHFSDKSLEQDNTIVFFFLRKNRNGRHVFYRETIKYKTVECEKEVGKHPFFSRKNAITWETGYIITNHIQKPLVEIYKEMRTSSCALEVYLQHQGDVKTVMNDLQTALNNCNSPEAERIMVDRIFNVVDYTFRHLQAKIKSAIDAEKESAMLVKQMEDELEKMVPDIALNEPESKLDENFIPFERTEMINTINKTTLM